MNKILNQTLKIIKSEYFLFTLVIIFAFLVRLYKISSPLLDWHSWRQADTASVSKVFIQQGINLFNPRYHDISSIQSGIFNPQGYRMVEFPIFNAFHAIFFKAIPSIGFEAEGRLVSIFCSLITAFFLYLIGNKFIGKFGGILSAFFFLFIPYNIYFTRVILPEPMAVTFLISSLWFFVRFIESDRYYRLIISAIFFALGMLIKPYTLFYSLPMIYLLLNKFKLKDIFKESKLFIKLLIFVDIVLIPFFLWRTLINKHPEGIPFFTWAFNGDNIRFRQAYWRWIYGERIGYLILGIWGLVPFTYGLLKTSKKNLFNFYFLIGLLLYTLVVATASVRHDYYQIFLIPAIVLMLAQGVKHLWEDKHFNSYISKFLVIFSVIMMLGMGTYQVKEFYKINHPELIEAGKAVDRLAPKNALVVAPYNGDTAFLYQTGRWGWPELDDSIDNIIKKGASFYVSVNIGDKNTQAIMKRFKVVEKTDKYVVVNLHEPLNK